MNPNEQNLPEKGIMSTNSSLTDKKDLRIDPDDVFVEGSESMCYNSKKPIYQSCPSKQGYIEQILPDGTTKIGTFKSGFFVEFD
jgi:predicted Abi (CAAX) family protease